MRNANDAARIFGIALAVDARNFIDFPERPPFPINGGVRSADA